MEAHGGVVARIAVARTEAVAEPVASRSHASTAALLVMQAGAIAVVVAVVTHRVFELDRFFVPKELVLHVTALVAGLLTARAFGRLRATAADVLLAAFLAVSALSVLFATNGWAGARALAISISGVALFWAARVLRAEGRVRALIAALAAAVVVGAITSLLQTYGVASDLFSVNRAPGGTLGNRNFVAHLAAFGMPLVLFSALAAQRRAVFLLWSLGAALVAATLVLTRSRAGWLAFAAALLVLVAALLLAAPLRRSRRVWLRLAAVIGLAGVMIAGAVLLPNALQWRSETPYLESMRALTEHREGSGRGRLVQYRQTLSMTLAHPLLGVGPGNWAVEYPGHAPANDPSLDRTAPGMTSNPWPSSDWIALIAERGPFAALLFLAALLVVAWHGARALFRAPSTDDALAGGVLLAVLAATAVAGAFDAVLLLALPTLLVWPALGVLMPAAPVADAAAGPARWRRFRPGIALLIVSLAAGLGAARSAGSLAAVHVFDTRSDTAALRRAAMLDPGNYRLRVRLARSVRDRAERCEHALAANALYPHARAAQQLSRGCR